MKIKDKIISILKSTCIIFTIISLVIITMSDLAQSSETTNPHISASLWTFFAFSVLLAVINQILKSPKLSPAVALLLHFLCCTALFYVVVIQIGGFGKNGKQTMVALLLFGFAYLIFVICHVITVSVRKRKKIKSKKYESMIK